MADAKPQNDRMEKPEKPKKLEKDEKPEKSNKPDRVVVHAYPPLIFIWPLIFLGYLFSLLPVWGNSLKVEAWIYACALVIVLLTIGIDVNRNVTIFWLVLAALIWIGVLYLRDAMHVVFFSHIANWIASRNPQWSPDFGLVSSVLLSIAYVIIVFKAYLNDRWVFSNNEIEHWAFGRNDDSMGRGAKVVSTTYPDILEMILMLAGTITVYDARRTRVLAVIRGVPFLPFRAARINKVLESVPVTDAAIEDETDDYSDDDHEDGGLGV